MRLSIALGMLAALLTAALPATMYARGFGGFHGGGFHGGSHGFGGFRGIHGMGFHGAHFAGLRIGHRHFGVHTGRFGPHHAAALGYAAAGHRLAHGNHVATLHGHPGLNGARHGRFAANAFGNRHAWNRWGHRWHHWHPVWFGSTFWPFLYGDFLSFAFWPYAYYDPFWDYGLYWILYGILWPGTPVAHRLPYDVYGERVYGYNRARLPADGEAVVNACVGLAPGVADLPIDRMGSAIRPTGDQVTLLNDLKAASSRANTALKASCPNEVPLTPVGRLEAIEQRFDTASHVLDVLRSPLAAFYDSLTAEQTRRFDAIAMPSRSRDKTVICDQRTASFSSLPTERIEQTVRPNQEQKNLLDALLSAASKAASELQTSCPAEVPQTILERLGAIEIRIKAMLDAARIVRPALDSFYASLDDEQKARFNAMQNS